MAWWNEDTNLIYNGKYFKIGKTTVAARLLKKMDKAGCYY
ncbi:hypothetical protein NC651_017864 [Populus alba x Populus x berolinensis]|nr:hypothetical protein NC651_017864 [Populus alba x Populus x berolinensis]